MFYALSAWDGFLNSLQINRINAFFRNAGRFGLCSSTCLCDVSEHLRLADFIDYLIAYKVLPTASHICFHQKSTTLAYVPEVTVIHFPDAQTTTVSPLYPQIKIILVLLFVIVGVIWLSFKPACACSCQLCIFYTAGVGEIGEKRCLFYSLWFWLTVFTITV